MNFPKRNEGLAAMAQLDDEDFQTIRHREPRPPEGYLTLRQTGEVIGIQPRTIIKYISRAVAKDLGVPGKNFRAGLSETERALLESLRFSSEGETQRGWYFPRGLMRKGNRWYFPKDEIRSFLEIRVVRARAALKTAIFSLDGYKNRFENDLQA